MPKQLLNRLRAESIHEYRAAAAARLRDGDALAVAGRRLGAIYLWGYVAEMYLKAWYFEVIVHGRKRPITDVDRKAAAQRAKTLGTKTFHRFHDLIAWADSFAPNARTSADRLLRCLEINS